MQILGQTKLIAAAGNVGPAAVFLRREHDEGQSLNSLLVYHEVKKADINTICHGCTGSPYWISQDVVITLSKWKECILRLNPSVLTNWDTRKGRGVPDSFSMADE